MSSLDVHTPGRLLWYSFAYWYTFAVLQYSISMASEEMAQKVHAWAPPYLKEGKMQQFEMTSKAQKIHP